MSALAVFIADDEAPARERIKELLADIASEVPTRVVGEARNGLDALEQVPGSGARGLLLDIEMPGMDGLELARHLGALEDAPAIVFVTAHDEHAVEAFEVNALDYLMKPVRAARLTAALRKAADEPAPDAARLARAARGPRQYFSVTERSRIVLVPVREVVYFKAELKYVTLRTPGGEYLIEDSLVALEHEFAQDYVRIHRNCLVARDAMRSFERAGGGDDDPHWNVVLEGIPERLPVSRRQWPLVKGLVTQGRE